MSLREFTENWLQALMLAADNAAARRIRPWMTDIANLCAVQPLDGQVDAAKRLWDYASAHALRSLIETQPLQQHAFHFDDDECFRFSCAQSPAIDSPDAFVASLGVVAMERAWVAQVTQSDWSNLLRKEAVRRSKPLNVLTMPSTTLVDVPCRAVWNLQQWTIHFQQPDWLTIEQSGPALTVRPTTDAIDARMLDAIVFADQKLKATSRLSNFQASDALWMACVPDLAGWNRSILLSKDVPTSPWFQRVWCAVWPVVYRERNRLRGAFDLQALRKEIAECFQHAPELTEWMFLFARLVLECRLERGLGIAGDFVDE